MFALCTSNVTREVKILNFQNFEFVSWKREKLKLKREKLCIGYNNVCVQLKRERRAWLNFFGTYVDVMFVQHTTFLRLVNTTHTPGTSSSTSNKQRETISTPPATVSAPILIAANNRNNTVTRHGALYGG